MNIVILCSDDVFAGILAYPLMRQRQHEIKALLCQSNVMLPGKTPLQLFQHVVKKSGWRYPIYQAIERIGYRAIERFRHMTGLNREPAHFLAVPSDLARRFGFPFYPIGNVHAAQTLDKIRMFQPDLIISLRFSQIVKQKLIDIPRLGGINFHGSLLPQYAGLGAIFQAVSHRESYAGCTVHMLDETIDSGAIVEQTTVPIYKHDTVARVTLRVHIQGALLLCDAVNRMERGGSLPEPRSDLQASYFSWPAREDVKAFVQQKGTFISVFDLLWLLLSYTCDPEQV
jgi:hypothetical protein